MSLKICLLSAAVCLLLGTNRPVTAVNYAECVDSFSLAILLDSSVSIPGADMVYRPLDMWKSLIAFTQSVVTALTTAPNISVTVIRFSTTAIVSVPLTPLQPSSGFNLNTLQTLTYIGGNTNTAEALSLAEKELRKDTSGRRKLALVLTDGLSNINPTQTGVQAASLKDSGVVVFAVGLTDYIDDDAMENIVTPPSNVHLLQVSNMTQLLKKKDLIVSRLCGFPDPTDPPPGVCSTVQNCLTCQTNPNVCDRCNNGYFKNAQGLCSPCLPFCSVCVNDQTCDTCAIGYYRSKNTQLCKLCQYRADVAFLVDTSGSIRDKNPQDKSYDNFNIILKFITNILDRLPLGGNDTHVAEVTFSSSAMVYFGLNTFANATRKALYNAILASPYDGSYTNTSGALRLLRTVVFTPEGGDRPDYPNVGIIITDGLSNIDSNQTLPEAQLDRNMGITMYSVGVTNQFNTDELIGIASSPQNSFTAPDFVSLTTSIYDALGNTLCGG